MAHIHLYRKYPPSLSQHWVGCLNSPLVPALAVGDTIDYNGERFSALPCWKKDAIVVEVDRRGAQVATPAPENPHEDVEDTKQLVGTGSGQWHGPS